MRMSMLLVFGLVACGSGNGGGKKGSGGAENTNTSETIDDNDTGLDEGTDLVDAWDCEQACEEKGAECQAPPSILADACAQLCSSSLTSEQLECLEASSCAELGEAFEGGSVCGIGEPTTPTGNGDGECQCEPNSQAPNDDYYGYCEGTSVCDFNGDPITGCLHVERTGIGECVATCGQDDAGTQGSCGDGQICVDSGKPGAGGNWYVCE